MTQAKYGNRHDDESTGIDGVTRTIRANRRKSANLIFEYALTTSMHSTRIMWILALSSDRTVHSHGMQITHPTESEESECTRLALNRLHFLFTIDILTVCFRAPPS